MYVWHRIEKVGMVCFCTCRGWPAWPIQGSLMLQISKVGISPILQERESYAEQGSCPMNFCNGAKPRVEEVTFECYIDLFQSEKGAS